jgi:hypothetical protein
MIILAERPEQVRELMDELLLEEEQEQQDTEQLVWTYIQSPDTLSDMAEFIPDTRSALTTPQPVDVAGRFLWGSGSGTERKAPAKCCDATLPSTQHTFTE